jgi:hypothetical protein
MIWTPGELVIKMKVSVKSFVKWSQILKHCRNLNTNEILAEKIMHKTRHKQSELLSEH